MGIARTVTLSGEYDFANKEVLAAKLRPAVDADVAIIEMGDVHFMDSSAISCLISLKKAMVLRGGLGTIRLARVSPHIARVFRICGLDRIFEIEDAATVNP